jgi:hypothetical protein
VWRDQAKRDEARGSSRCVARAQFFRMSDLGNLCIWVLWAYASARSQCRTPNDVPLAAFRRAWAITVGSFSPGRSPSRTLAQRRWPRRKEARLSRPFYRPDSASGNDRLAVLRTIAVVFALTQPCRSRQSTIPTTVREACGVGMHRVDGVCVPNRVTRCEAGMRWVGGR